MRILFAKTKKAGIIAAVLAAVFLFLSVYAAYFAIGNIRCAIDSPILVSESGNAFFIGYQILAVTYTLLSMAAIFCFALFAVNAVNAFINNKKLSQ